MKVNFSQHKRSYLFYVIASILAIVISSLFKFEVVSVKTDRILQVIVVVISVSAFYLYRRFKAKLLTLRTVQSVEERFSLYSRTYRAFWLQLFAIIAIDSFGYFVTANTSFLVLAVSVLVHQVIFLPSRMSAHLILQIPKDHSILK